MSFYLISKNGIKLKHSQNIMYTKLRQLNQRERPRALLEKENMFSESFTLNILRHFNFNFNIFLYFVFYFNILSYFVS